MAKKNTKKQKDKKRVDLDVRPIPFFTNYDYGGPEEESETSPGRGLYNGNMGKYKSVSELLEKARKRKMAFRRLAYQIAMASIEND